MISGSTHGMPSPRGLAPMSFSSVVKCAGTFSLPQFESLPLAFPTGSLRTNSANTESSLSSQTSTPIIESPPKSNRNDSPSSIKPLVGINASFFPRNLSHGGSISRAKRLIAFSSFCKSALLADCIFLSTDELAVRFNLHVSEIKNMIHALVDLSEL